MASDLQIAQLTQQLGRQPTMAEVAALDGVGLGGPPAPAAVGGGFFGSLDPAGGLEAPSPGGPVAPPGVPQYDAIPAEPPPMFVPDRGARSATPMAQPSPRALPSPTLQPELQRRAPSPGADARRKRDLAFLDAMKSYDRQADRTEESAQSYDDYQDERDRISLDREIQEEMAREDYIQEQDELRRRLDEKMSKVEDAAAALQETPPKIEISRKAKVMAGLASMFGSLAQLKAALYGGVNIGNDSADLLDRAIQREVEQQKRDYERKRDRYNVANSEYALAKQRLGDSEQAEALAVNAVREKYALQVEDAAGAFQTEQQKTAALNTADALRQKKAETQSRFFDAAYREAQAAAAARAKAARNFVQLPVGGLEQVAPATEQDRKEAQKITTAGNKLLATIGQLKEMARKGGSMSLAERRTGARLVETLISQSTQFAGSGVPQEAEAQRWKDIIANPAEYNLADVERFYQQYEAQTLQGLDSQLGTYGYRVDPGRAAKARVVRPEY